MKDDSNEKLTLGDWIAFLSSKSASDVSTIISVGAIVVAVITGMLAINKVSWVYLITILIVYILAISYLLIVERFKQSARTVTTLLNRIMKGDLKTASDVQEEWKKFLAKQEAKENWWLKMSGKIRRGLGIILNFLGLRRPQGKQPKEDREGKKLETKPSQELSLADVMEELKSAKRAIWMGPAAFGGSIVLLGASIKVQQMVGDKSWTVLSVIIIGFAFMLFCMCKALRS